MSRASRPEVRNPVLALPAARRLGEWIDAGAQRTLARLLEEIAKDAGSRAREAWARHKAPMACYWKMVSVYARHIARAIRAIDVSREGL